MPLLDHFHPPLSVDRPWEGVHGAWAAAIAGRLNDELPEDYFALPLITVGGHVEVDVGTYGERGGAAGNSSLATAVWAPPALTAEVDFVGLDAYEVRVMQQLGGP